MTATLSPYRRVNDIYIEGFLSPSVDFSVLLSIYTSNKKGQGATFRKWKVHPEEFNKKRDLDVLQTLSISETFSE